MKIIKIPLEMDFKKLAKNLKSALKTAAIHRPHVSLQNHSLLKYEDVGFASVWAIEDKNVLEELYFKRIRRLDWHFTEAKEQNRRIIMNNRFGFLNDEKYRLSLNIMNEVRKQKHEIISSFEDRIKKSFDDKTIHDGIEPALAEVSVNGIELLPVKAAVKDDMMVNDGMERFAALICNESNTYFTYYAVGASVIPSGIGQTKLLDERARAPIDEFGWFSAIGTLIRGGAQFPESIPSFSIAESAACDAAAGGIIAWRTAYPTPVAHTQNATFPVASHVVYQIPAGANSS
jgi:hypothetical protein